MSDVSPLVIESFASLPGDTLVREKAREQITGISRVHWWRYERVGLAPKRIHVSPGRVAWPLCDLLEWNRQRKHKPLPIVRDDYTVVANSSP